MKTLMTAALGLSLLVSGVAIAAQGGGTDAANQGRIAAAEKNIGKEGIRPDGGRRSHHDGQLHKPPHGRADKRPPHGDAQNGRSGTRSRLHPGMKMPASLQTEVVNNHSAHALRAAPKGQAWQRMGNRFFLVDIASKDIMEVVIKPR